MDAEDKRRVAEIEVRNQRVRALEIDVLTQHNRMIELALTGNPWKHMEKPLKATIETVASLRRQSDGDVEYLLALVKRLAGKHGDE